MPAVVRDRVDQARQQRRPQRVELRRQRIGHARRSCSTSPRGERLRGLRLDEAERDRFGQAGRRQHAPHAADRADRAGRAAAPAAVIGRERRLELVEPVVPADLFDQIDFAQQIDAEGRRDDVPSVGRRRHVKPERAQNPLDLRVGHRQAEQRSASRCAPQVERLGRAAPG